MPNVVQPQVDGPLKVEGEIWILAADGSLIKKVKQGFLCRCGKSATKPLCDGSHKVAGFSDPAVVSTDYQPKSIDSGTPGSQLRITLRSNGPLRCFGEFRVEGATGSVWQGTQASLCRCGGSNNKPFCDGSHKEVGFEAA